MRDAELPVGGWTQYAAEQTDQCRIQRTPVPIQQFPPLPRQHGVAEVHVRDAVRRRVESGRPCLGAGEGEESYPRAGADSPHAGGFTITPLSGPFGCSDALYM